MIKELTLFEIKYHLKQLGFWIAAFAFIWLAIIVTSQRGSATIFANSPFAITQAILFISPNIIFAICILASNSLLRDFQYNASALIFTTTIDKFQYLSSRFIGMTIASIILFLFVLTSMIITIFFLDNELVGGFNFSYYVISFTIFMLPSIILCNAIVFSTAMLSKNMLAVYVSGIVIYCLYLIGSILGNSPLMAASNSLIRESNSFAALIEPYGLMAFMEQTAYLSQQELNTHQVTLSGNLLSNRLLWITVSFTLFVITYKRFTFKKLNKKVAKKPMNHKIKIGVKDGSAYSAIESNHLITNFTLKPWFSSLKIEYLTATKGKTFIVLLLTAVTFSLATIVGGIFEGPITGSQPYYPYTSIIVEQLHQPITEIGLLIAIFYTVELYWTDKSVKISPLIDTTPSDNLIFYLAKLTAVLMICLTLVVSSIVVAIGLQFYLGAISKDILDYWTLIYYSIIPVIVVSILTLSAQRFASSKATGLILGLVLFLISIAFKMIDLEHPLLVLAYRPQLIYSAVTDTTYYSEASNIYNLYWLAWALIVGVIAVKYWRRGDAKQNPSLNFKSRILLGFGVVTLLASGGYIYYQVNVFNHFQTKQDKVQFYVDYEKKYSKYKTLKQPTITDIKVDVDIYPSQQKYVARGKYLFQNKTNKPINELLISILKQSHVEYNVHVEEAELVKLDSNFNTYLFKLSEAMLPNETQTLNFELLVAQNPYTKLDGEHYITSGGSYFELEDVVPKFGFRHDYVITDFEQRDKYSLSKYELRIPSKDENIVLEDRVNFDSTVSTDSSQTVIAVGKLQKKWSSNKRNYFHYKSVEPVAQQFAYTSAAFEETRRSYNGVDISIFHHPGHSNDNALIFHALESTMSYFSKNIAPYRSNQYKVVELPYFSSEQSFGSSQPEMFLGVENRYFNLDNRNVNVEQFNPLLRGVSHEFAHQYWGGYVDPNYISGYHMITEVLSKYIELVMARDLYGESANNKEVSLSIDRYLRSRSHNKGTEKPLYLVGSESNLYYNKGKYVMHALIDLIGEKNINIALKEFVQSHQYPNKPNSLDLLDSIYNVSNDYQSSIIDDLFKNVVFHDLNIDSATVTKTNSGLFETKIDVTTIKYMLNQETNIEQPTSLNELLDVSLYSEFPTISNSNAFYTKKFLFNKDKNSISIITKSKPEYVQIDPNRYRIDRNLKGNIFQIIQNNEM